ncbi:hypothetical protein COT42_02295 [Candidatus Saganbacteria bacterium CG08_land_8_20_14_0_20_45_16]|uniref:Type II/III secretion system secretin-like domain-containing protein n=1 Tax=Candidatus Saganbacteria bacterium CG08_land_8_20_14_0_20_45_16 TaxID=2014293 RepID=A0A2H0Y060_UNCSA|nr:MAG: hypothetical protein COT42_02295 [Candidatus Saganbacteria bacterium CG08_land_8_20_14_0_20_45_16]
MRLLICLMLSWSLSLAVLAKVVAEINFKEAAVMDVVEALAQEAGCDVVVSGDKGSLQSRRASLHLKNAELDTTIDQLLISNGIAYERRGKILYISCLPEMVQLGKTETWQLKFLTAEKASLIFSKVLPTIKTSAGQAASSLVLQGDERALLEAEKLLVSIDQPEPQVLIETKVVEIAQSDSLKLGLSLGSPAGTFGFLTDKNTGRTNLANDLITTLNGLISSGQAKVVAAPKIAALDGHEAEINIGSRIPYAVPVTSGSSATQWTVDYLDAGVKLKITPLMVENGLITAHIQPEVSSISEWRTTSAGDFPVITTRNAQSTLRVKDGESIVVGGLISESDRNNLAKLPLLGDLPLLGYLFQNTTVEKTKTEIVFIITPHII